MNAIELRGLCKRFGKKVAVDNIDLQTATDKVKESYSIYRDGVEIFAQEYKIPHKDLYTAL